MQIEVELILSNCFEVLGFICDKCIICCIFIKGGYVQCFGVGGCQVDVVCIIFQISSLDFSVFICSIQVVCCFYLVVSMVRFCIGCIYVKIFVFICCGQIEIVVVRFVCVVMVVFVLVLCGEVQIFNQVKEVSVMVGGNISSMVSYEDVSLSSGIVIKFWQNVGLCVDVVSNVVVMIVVERIVVSEFQISKCQMGFVFVSVLVFSMVVFEFIFLLVKIG